VVDGSGGAPFQADIAVRQGRIVQVGIVPGAGAEEVDAIGRIVTPGFVDIHTHYDGQITWENRLRPSSDHGVTTVVMGNCGVGFAPVKPDDHDLVICLMEGVEDIPGVVMAEGVREPAEAVGLLDRGLIRPGMMVLVTYADDAKPRKSSRLKSCRMRRRLGDQS